MSNILILNMMLHAYNSPSIFLTYLTFHPPSYRFTFLHTFHSLLSYLLLHFPHSLSKSFLHSSIPPFIHFTVSVGDCIMTVSGEEKVTSVERVLGEGVYTVVTNAEYVVVNGIIASPFGVNHMMGNLYYNVHRMVYASAPALLKLYWLSNANEVCLLITVSLQLLNS